jgi:hypothetical protein
MAPRSVPANVTLGRGFDRTGSSADLTLSNEAHYPILQLRPFGEPFPSVCGKTAVTPMVTLASSKNRRFATASYLAATITGDPLCFLARTGWISKAYPAFAGERGCGELGGVDPSACGVLEFHRLTYHYTDRVAPIRPALRFVSARSARHECATAIAAACVTAA